MVENYLNELNEQQRIAVTRTQGPLLILAGAGAGKTKTLTHRILHLIHEGVSPENILAITFTNKAAREMRDRIEGLLASDSSLNTPLSIQSLPFTSTFHALGVHILRANADKLPVTRSFSILDRNDSIRMMKEAITQAGHNPKEQTPTKLLGRISREKGKNNTHARFQELHSGDYFSTIVGDVWQYYEKIKTDNNALDFDDLLLQTATVLRRHEDIREMYQNKWRHIHIDEYQDTNEVQNEIATLLAGDAHNICAVGDIDQNIYSWRGAQIRHILEFEEIFPKTKLVVLEQNYRSTQNILTAANQIIEKNIHRKEKKLFTTNTEGEKIELYVATTENDEARFIAHTARSLINNGINQNEIAVLYRANFQSRVLEEAFLHYDVPYQLLGTRFFERKEVKDVLTFIRCAINPENTADLARVINVPPRGIGKVTLAKIVNNQENELNASMTEKVRNFRALLSRIKECSETRKMSETVRFVITETGLDTALKSQGDEGLEQLENLRELVTLATKYDTLEPLEATEKLLEEAALASDQDTLNQPKDGVKLMTVHAAKGLEFEHVFVTGLEEGLFPHTKFDSETMTPEEAEEERRLFYVALTRAKKKLHLTYASVRTIFGTQEINIPSEFLSDIDEELFEEPLSDQTPDKSSGGLLGWPGDDEPTISF